MTHETIEIAQRRELHGLDVRGTVPGPVIRVRQGDLVRITLVNQSKGHAALDRLPRGAHPDGSRDEVHHAG